MKSHVRRNSTAKSRSLMSIGKFPRGNCFSTMHAHNFTPRFFRFFYKIGKEQGKDKEQGQGLTFKEQGRQKVFKDSLNSRTKD